MSRPRRHALTVRVVRVPDPHATQAFDRVLDHLADALAEVAITEARAEVASRLGVASDAIDREQRGLHRCDRDWLSQASERGAA